VTHCVFALTGAVAAALAGGAPQSEAPESIVQRISESIRAEGGLKGRVRLKDGIPPHPTAVENATDPTVCGRHQTLEDLVISPRDRGIRNVIVALEDLPPEKIPSLIAERLVLDNRKCRFAPHAAVITVGSRIEALNSDPVLHTVHLYGALEANIALPIKGARIGRIVDRPGMIVVKCDVHGWMQAFIRVDSHPFHAVSAADGTFRIDRIPPGSYKISAWHEKLGRLERTVRIEEGKIERLELEYAFEVSR